MLQFDETTPAGRPLLSIDFTKLLPTGVTVASAVVTCTVAADSAAADATPSSRLDGSPTITGGAIVSQFFKTGVVNCDYILTFLATYSDGQKEPVDAEIAVRAFT